MEMKLPFFPPFQEVDMDIPTDRIRIQREDFLVEEEIERIKSVSKKIGGIAQKTFAGGS